jgi:hypothetical protein
MADMWWTAEEEELEVQAQLAWGMFPPEDIAAPVDHQAEPVADAEEPAEPVAVGDIAVNEEGPLVAFQWHIPEGAPAAGPPLVNGFHPGPPLLNGWHQGDDLEEDLAGVMHGPWAVFNPQDNFPG